MATKRYFFDLRDGNTLASDDEGVELPDIESVQEEAALSLADAARNADRRQSEHNEGHRMAIEVRDGFGPILKVFFSFESDKRRN